ncbi:MAG: acyltransferase [Fibrobacter sp.]|nr:acyltransferase [Fibrobacter sp.]
MQKGIATPDRFLSIDDSTVMKAIAILCMLTHHLWTFPERIAGGPLKSLISFSNLPLTVHLGVFGKICVSMFFFLGGYGLYKKYFGKRYNIAERLKKLYVAYWKVFLVFVPIGFIFFSNQTAYCQDAGVYSSFSGFSVKEFVLNFFGFVSTYNREWWFLLSYAIALILFPLIRKIVDNLPIYVNLFIIIAVSVLLTNVFDSEPYAICFGMGIIVAKHQLLDCLRDFTKSKKILNPVSDVLVWLLVIILRLKVIGEQFDIFFVPILTIASIDLVNRLSTFKKSLSALGKRSTNMWLIHTFFCYYFGVTAKIVAAPRYAILSLIVLFAMSYAASILVEMFWKKVGSWRS